MLDSMPHRGDDGLDVWTDGNVTLGHRMMHTTPESLFEKLPLRSSSGNFVLTCDARIDNRDELIGRLKISASALSGVVTDSEIILAAYEAWGDRCTMELIGDFAFVVWDSRKKELYAARDLIGVKPIYYTYIPGKLFAVATEIKALLTLTDVPIELNEVRVADLLTSMVSDHENTLYNNVFKIPAGHQLRVSTSGCLLKRYGELEPESRLSDMTDADYAEQLQGLMFEAVKCRLRSAFPVSSQLSGGLDSSFVTCIAAGISKDEGKDPLKTVSIVFEEATQSDEREFIESIVESSRISPDFIQGDKFGPLSDLEQIYEVVDDAIVGGNHHYIWRLLGKAHDQGARVVLDGIDGDTTIGHGYTYFKDLARAGEWETLADHVRKTVPRYRNIKHKHGFHEVLSSPGRIMQTWAIPELNEKARRGEWLNFFTGVREIHRLFKTPIRVLLRRNIFRLIIPHVIWKRRAEIRKRMTSVTGPIDRMFATRIGIVERHNRSSGGEPGFLSMREDQQMKFNCGGLGDYMATLDHYGAAHGIELRHPFFDVRLIRFCLSLPPDQSFSNGWTRIIMRRAMETFVPKIVCWRPGKADMTAGFKNGLFGVNRERLEDYTSKLGLAEKYIDSKALKMLRDNKNSLDAAGRTNLEIIAVLSFWMNKTFLPETVQRHGFDSVR